MRLWPPLLWLGVSIGSLLILRGSSGHDRPALVIAGLALLIAVLAAGVWLALRPRRGSPRRPAFYWALAGLGGFYVALAAVASLAGAEYAVAALLGGVIPLAALALIIATIRTKTAEQDGSLVDASAEAHDDPLPGIGLDDQAPTGETPELHDPRREDAPDRRFQRRTERAPRR